MSTSLRQWAVGDVVFCPPDRGDAAYYGRVTHVDPTVNVNLDGVPYQWVTVRKAAHATSHVWPSHRLSH